MESMIFESWWRGNCAPDSSCSRRSCASGQQSRPDWKLREQLIDAAESGPRNIAEGFGRFYHPEGAQFARIAKASEDGGVWNHFIDAHDKGWLSDEGFRRHERAVKKALKVLNRWIRYLEDTPGFGKG